MKTLFLIRHAKSDWTFNLPDFERPLNARGLRNAPMMAERLRQYKTTPDVLVSSPAKRALTTAQFFAQTLKIPANQIQLEEHIYEADVHTLLKLINTFDNHTSTVALFGHNPGISLLAAYLCPEFHDQLPTCAMVHLAFETDNWAEISGDSAHLKWFTYPKLV